MQTSELYYDYSEHTKQQKYRHAFFSNSYFSKYGECFIYSQPNGNLIKVTNVINEIKPEFINPLLQIYPDAVYLGIVDGHSICRSFSLCSKPYNVVNINMLKYKNRKEKTPQINKTINIMMMTINKYELLFPETIKCLKSLKKESV